ncbi:MAG: hypothetical protein Q7T55_09670, partial [Solirubrobacteraceae bacterium]|nr:hypothetical protein [Solirubrobacteraceae bacterium]
HHVGIAIGGGRMLHIDRDQDSCLVDYTTGKWAPRLVGAYRHKEWIMAGLFGLPPVVPPVLAATTCLPIAALAVGDSSGRRVVEMAMRQTEPA